MAMEVKVDLNLLDQAVGIYDTQIDALEQAYTQADRSLEELRKSAWKSSGADAFFQNYDDTWKRDFQDHIDYLKHLRDCLKLAREGFYEEYERKIN